jgi:hypothetical protein
VFGDDDPAVPAFDTFDHFGPAGAAGKTGGATSIRGHQSLDALESLRPGWRGKCGPWRIGAADIGGSASSKPAAGTALGQFWMVIGTVDVTVLLPAAS